MNISIEVVNFEAEMERIREEVQQIANQDLLTKTVYATDQLRTVTPVDTGEARSGWKQRPVPELDGSVGSIISNDVEHIIYLNRGHSRQAPAYFIEQVLSTIGLVRPE